MESATQPLLGPLQLVVIGFPVAAQFRGEIIRELADVRGRGVIRLIDALFVRKDAQGRLNASIHESDLTLVQREVLGAIVGGLFGIAAGGDDKEVAQAAEQAGQAIADDAFGLGIGDLQNVKDRIPPGSAALLLLIEHLWALDLKGAVRNAGGVPLAQGFLTREAVFMMGAEVRAVMDAEDTIALAQAVQSAALLAALASVQAAELVEQAAAAEAARVLIAAGLIEAAAAQDVINTLVAADLIKHEALAEAQAAVDAAQAEVADLTPAQSATNGDLSTADVPASQIAG